MANSTTNLDVLTSSQSGKEITANALFDAGSNATIFGRRASTSAGLVWGFYGGIFRKFDKTYAAISNGTLTLSASATNYVQADRTTGAVSSNTTAFSTNFVPLYIVVTGASSVTSYTDYRCGTHADGSLY